MKTEVRVHLRKHIRCSSFVVTLSAQYFVNFEWSFCSISDFYSILYKTCFRNGPRLINMHSKTFFILLNSSQSSLTPCQYGQPCLEHIAMSYTKRPLRLPLSIFILRGKMRFEAKGLCSFCSFTTGSFQNHPYSQANFSLSKIHFFARDVWQETAMSPPNTAEHQNNE